MSDSTIKNSEQVSIEIKKAAQLSLTEIGIGSLGHGFKIPLTGHLLSLNQLAFLLNAMNKDNLPKTAVFEISGIAATLKSLSPAGRKIGPMLSIAMQGFLFWFGVSIFGSNIIGQTIAAFLLSLWAFIQPVITLLIIYGLDFSKLINFYQEKVSPDYSFIAFSFLYAVILIVLLKLAVAFGFVIYSLYTKKEITLLRENKMSHVVMNQILSKKQQSPLRGALNDLTRPIFLLSFILMALFVWQLNGSVGDKIWLSMRPLAIAFILFYMTRSPWIAQKASDLSKKSKAFERLYSKARLAAGLIIARQSKDDHDIK